VRTLALTGVVLASAVVAFAYSAFAVRHPGKLPWGRNYRGLELPIVLGLAAAATPLLWVVIVPGGSVIDTDVHTGSAERALIGSSISLAALAGLYDDFRSGAARGIRLHLRELAHGRLTSGVIKLLVIVGAATWAAMGLDGTPLRILLGVPVIAGAANLWNLLDVRPGRAVKAFLVAALALVGWYVRYDDLLIPVAIGSAAALLIWDLREKAMLGDAGSNVLGFLIGLALYRLLPTWGLGVALALILILHALGETVTLSRIIDSTPPLRSFDRLGRLPAEQAKPESGSTPRDSSPT
jgi:UDP-GlcNAc:undecaprenyl-phosphate GlcNAc-1-phosphate transferase